MDKENINYFEGISDYDLDARDFRDRESYRGLGEEAGHSSSRERSGPYMIGDNLKRSKKSPLLTREQEVEIAKRIEAEREKILQILKHYPMLIESDILSAERPFSDYSETMDSLVEKVMGELEDCVKRLRKAEEVLHYCEEKTGLSYEELRRLARMGEENPMLATRIFEQTGLDRERLTAFQANAEKAVSEARLIRSRLQKDLDRLEEDVDQIKGSRSRINAAKKEFAEANLRLAVNMAYKYTGKGVHISDLIQEGYIGLLKAIDKFDYRLGFKFSTYASWWIRQAMVREVQNQGRTIRMPVHMIDLRRKVHQIAQELSRQTGRKTTPEEVAEVGDLPLGKVKRVFQNLDRKYTVSLEAPIGDSDSQLSEIIEDKESPSPEAAFINKNMADNLDKVLATLTPREETILRKRFGIGGERAYTLEELGQELGVTRERIRQLEKRAIAKLRNPSRRKRLANGIE